MPSPRPQQNSTAPVPGQGQGHGEGGNTPTMPSLPQMQAYGHPQFYGQQQQQQGGGMPQYQQHRHQQQGAPPQYQPLQPYPPDGQMAVPQPHQQQTMQANQYAHQPQYHHHYGDGQHAGYHAPVGHEPQQHQHQQPPAVPSPQQQHQQAAAAAAARAHTANTSSPRKPSPHEAWEAKFVELTEFHAEFGHADVPQTYKKNRSLGKWVGKQREHYKTLQETGQSPLHEDRINKLTSLGFKFQMGKGQHAKIHGFFMTDKLIENWEDRFKDLVAFKEQHGHTDVPVKYPQNKALGRWAAMQRRKHRAVEKKEINTSASLLEDRMQRLRDLGFKFELGRGDYVRGESYRTSTKSGSGGNFTSHDAIWEVRLGELKAYKAEHGCCDVPMTYTAVPKLAAWVAKQRELWRNKRDNKGGRKLTDERVAKLDALGFHFRAYEATWEAKLADLREYKAKYGNVNVRDANSRPLWHWSKRQRDCFKDFLDGKPGPMTHNRICQLEELGFDWKYFDTDAKAQKRSTTKSSKTKESTNGKDMPADVANAGQMAHQQASGGAGSAVLPMEGNTADASNVAVNNAFNGGNVHPTAMPNLTDTNGIMGTPNDAQVASPSEHYLLSDEAVKKGTKPEKWLRNYEELVAYKNMHGDTRIPCRSKEYPRLGSWVKLQREDYRKMQNKQVTPMCKWRIDLLEKIGFEWRLAPAHGPTPWDERFAELEEFKKDHGHCNVPQAWRKNVPLGKWCSKQRDFYRFLKEGKPSRLDEDKIAKMESIGFQWFVGKGKGLRTWKDYFDDCVAFKTKYGHTNIPLGYEYSPALGTWANQQRINYKKVQDGTVQKKEVLEHNRLLVGIDFNFHSSDVSTTSTSSKTTKRTKSKKDKAGGGDPESPKRKRGRTRKNQDDSPEQETKGDAGEEKPRESGRPGKTTEEPPEDKAGTKAKESEDIDDGDGKDVDDGDGEKPGSGEEIQTAEV